MSITLSGPDWPTVRELRTALAAAPETGSFTIGGRKYDAIQQLQRFRDHGVRTVEFTDTRTTAEDWVRKGFVVLARRSRHSQGRDVIARGGAALSLPALRRWAERDWWCKYIPSVGEWRIHIFDGRSIGRGRKVFQPDWGVAAVNGVPQHPVPAIRSRRNGWHLDHTLDPPPEVRDAAKAAVAALDGYSYGAVDVLLPADGTIPVVLEVNLLPAMDDYTRGRYVEAIRRRVREAGSPRPPTAIG